MTPFVSRPASRIAGDITAPGDKSISHRSLLLAALAAGRSRVSGLLEGDDVLATAAALRALGAEIVRETDHWRIDGVGIGGLSEPENVLDLGNSGTGARLLMGLLASHPMTAVLTGDASLRSRPMARISTPLSTMGARFLGRAGGRLPMTVIGAERAMAIDYTPPVASAQVKSAVLLAGLNAPGETVVREAVATRDHSEHMLRHFGAEIAILPESDGGRTIRLTGQPELRPADVEVPGDVSSAAFPLVAALIAQAGELRIRDIGLNPLRAGLLDTLVEMGADIEIENRRDRQFEPIGDLVVRPGELRGVTVPAARVPSMIDEYPILAVAAAFARGRTVMRGAAELRVKESDRIRAMARGLAALGVAVEEVEDGLIVTGTGRPPGPAGANARLATELDHRIAMSFLVFGTAARAAVEIDDCRMIDTSFPGFARVMNGLGADMGEAAS